MTSESELSENALAVDSVTMDYGDFRALSNLSITVKKGEIFGFLGPNGAGKTTTIKIISGLLHPVEGSVLVYGYSLEDEPQQSRQLIGYIPDRPFLYDKLTGDEYVAFVCGLWGMSREEALEKVTPYLRDFSIDRFRTKLIEGYSHGMKQKLVMSAALVHDPRLLIVDEPTVGLDPASVLVMKNLYKSMAASGSAVFLSTHSLAVAETVCDRIAILNRGKVIAQGTMAELREIASQDGGNLEELFLTITNEDDGA